MPSLSTLCKAFLFLSCIPIAAQADVSDRFHFSGFASFVAAKSLKSDALYGDSTSRIPSSVELRNYSKLGLRLTVDLHDKLELTAQMLAEGRDNFDPQFDWLFLSYHFNPNLVLHVGKYVNPAYMYSDSIDVGYAYQWVEPPGAIYGTSINKTLEGAKLVWNSMMGDSWTQELSIMLGKDETDLGKVGVEGSTLKMNKSAGIAWQINHDWLTLRASYIYSETSADLINNANMKQILGSDTGVTGDIYGNIAAILTAAGVSPARLSQKLNWDDDRSVAAMLGASLNFTYIFAQFEAIHSEINDTVVMGKQDAAYATIGTYLPNNITVALTAYQKRNTPNKSIMKAFDQAAAKAYIGLASMPDPTLATQLASLGQVLVSTIDAVQQRTRDGLSLSLRWDFHSNAAFKAEYLYEWQTDYNGLQNLGGGNPIRGVKNKFRPQAIRLGVDLAF